MLKIVKSGAFSELGYPCKLLLTLNLIRSIQSLCTTVFGFMCLLCFISFQLTAYHESGHAIVAFNTDGAHPIHKATIMPRGSALGMVTQLPSNDETTISKKQLLARLDVCMGGRVAEELIFGQDHVTTGASSDLNTATELAQYMVILFSQSPCI